jgi:glucose-1-phosphate thymidylyltransferase
MKIIVPMAGRGTRLRPHTLTVPKPLVKVAGKSIVQRLVEDLVKNNNGTVEEIAFIIGDFGKDVEQELLALAETLGAKGHIFHQEEKLGTAHAIMCAKDCLDGNVIIAFADTLYNSEFSLDTNTDGLLWVQRVEDPSAYGVVMLDDDGVVKEFIEKPTTFISDLAIIGIYFFKDGALLRRHLQHLLDNKIMDKGEYQLTDALENMKQEGVAFRTHLIEEWLDCGNKNALVYANQRVLDTKEDAPTIADSVELLNSAVIPPCYIGEGVVLENTIVGPYVSIGANTTIKNSVLKNSIIQNDTEVENLLAEDSMLGAHAKIEGTPKQLDLGDYSKLKV